MVFARTLGWLACIVYSTIPSFWFMVHPRADRWRASSGSPYKVLVPAWLLMWICPGAITWHWRAAAIYTTWWSWLPAAVFFAIGVRLYKLGHVGFSSGQLSGLPEVVAGHREQRLVTSGIRARVRHPVYLAHLCEMLAWSAGTGLLVCWALTAFAIVTGAVMIRMEDAELEKRFGEEFLEYRQHVPAVMPRFRA